MSKKKDSTTTSDGEASSTDDQSTHHQFSIQDSRGYFCKILSQDPSSFGKKVIHLIIQFLQIEKILSLLFYKFNNEK